MIVVTKVTKTCNAVPAQWEGTTDDGRCVYARYRWGRLRVGIGKTPTDAVRCVDEMVYPITQVGGPYHGDMDFARLKELTREVITWPETEEIKFPGEEP